MRMRLGKDLDSVIEREAKYRGLEPSILVRLIINQWIMESTNEKAMKSWKKEQRLKDKATKTLSTVEDENA